MSGHRWTNTHLQGSGSSHVQGRGAPGGGRAGEGAGEALLSGAQAQFGRTVPAADGWWRSRPSAGSAPHHQPAPVEVRQTVNPAYSSLQPTRRVINETCVGVCTVRLPHLRCPCLWPCPPAVSRDPSGSGDSAEQGAPTSQSLGTPCCTLSPPLSVPLVAEPTPPLHPTQPLTTRVLLPGDQMGSPGDLSPHRAGGNIVCGAGWSLLVYFCAVTERFATTPLAPAWNPSFSF